MNSAVEAVARAGAALLSWLGPITLATGAILLAALLADRLLERRVTASVRLLLYGAVVARLGLPAAWESPLGLLGIRPAGRVSAGDLDLSMVTVMPLEPAPASLGAGGWAAIAYALVTLVLLGRWAHARIVLRRTLRSARPLGLEVEGTPVMCHPQLGPLVTGLWRPRIVVPAALADQPDREPMSWVLRHERAHVRRRDLIVGSLVQLVCILAWPVLPIWIAARRMRALMELACDEQAVRGADGAARRRYGEVLLALAEPALPGRTLAPVLSFGSPLKGRLRALAARRRWPLAAQALVVGAVGAIAIACAGEPPGEENAGAAADAQSDAVEQASPASGDNTRESAWNATGRPKRDPNKMYGLRGPLEGAPGIASFADRPADQRSPAASAKPSAAGPQGRATPDGRFAPIVSYHGGAIWLYTRRSGSMRIGDAEPLESALRDALAETGSRTILIERSAHTPADIVQRVLEAARRAGATDHALIDRDDVVPRKPAVQRSGATRFDPILTITRNGALYLHNERVTLEGLEAALRRELSARGGDTLLLRGDKQALLGQNADLMAIAKRAGARNVAILTEPSQDEAAPDPARARPAAARGSLDKEIIRGVIKDHIGEVKACYEARLARKPALEGTVAVQFTIAASGKVVASALARSTMTDPAVENCVVKAVRRWEFPKPEGGGIVMVTYPFAFTPSNKPEAAAP